MKLHKETHELLLATMLLTIPISGKAQPTAAELLRHAADNLAVTTALHFDFTAHALTPGFQMAALAGGSGTILRPDHMVFSGTMQSTPVLAAPIVMAACGPDKYFEMGDGTFQKMQGLPDISRLLFAQDSGLMINILRQLEQPSTPRAETLDAVAAWHLTGIVPGKLLAILPGRDAATTTTGVVRADVWIGQKDMRLHRVTLNGPMFTSDSAQTTRTLTFSHFNEHVPLSVPRGHLPCSH